MDKRIFVKQLEHQWASELRWQNIERRYSAEDVWNLAGNVRIDHTDSKILAYAAVS